MKYEIYYVADVPKIVIKIVSNFFENEIKEYDYYSIITENILIDKIKYENTIESLYLLLKPLNILLILIILIIYILMKI